MHIETVKSLFTLFTGEDDYEKYMPLINLALSETEKMLRSDADCDDPRLDFLTAASAGFRLAQINTARDRMQNTLGGKLLTSQSDSGMLKYAEKLLYDYMELCSDLIEKSSFVFAGFDAAELGGLNA